MVLKFLVLGMLHVRPMSGYDLKKAFDASVQHFWTADRSQLYRTLAALVDDGLATVVTVPQESYPDRKEHHLTDAGRAALRQWLTSPLDVVDEREPFLGRVFFADGLSDDELRALLTARREQAAALRALLLAERGRAVPADGADRGLALRLATLDNGLRHAEAELAWIDATEQELLP